MRDYKKRIINKDAKRSKVVFSNKDAVLDATSRGKEAPYKVLGDDVVNIGKGMITSDIPDFININSGVGFDIREVFKDKPHIVKALKKAGYRYTNELQGKDLTSIKGIGKSSAHYILEIIL